MALHNYVHSLLYMYCAIFLSMYRSPFPYCSFVCSTATWSIWNTRLVSTYIASMQWWIQDLERRTIIIVYIRRWLLKTHLYQLGEGGHCLPLASSPGSRKGVGGKESLVHTVCACARNSPISGNLYSVSILPCQPLHRTHRILQQQSSFCLHCNLFLRRSILT